MSSKSCVKCQSPLDAKARFCGACGSEQPDGEAPRPAARTVFQGSGSASAPPAAAPAPNPVRSQEAFERTLSPSSSSPPARPFQPTPARVTGPRAATPASAELADLSGHTLNNRYLVEAKIGEGGFGAVYRAKQTQMGRTVALKVLHPRMAKDAQVLGRFKREAQASSQLRNPHTVQVYDFDQTPEGIMYLSMEMLLGRSLHSVITNDGPLDPMRVARVMDGIADSLGEAHTQGIVHRDIKPENIFLEPSPSPDFVKVLDFGIAKIVGGDGGMASGPALTAAGQTLGTLEYMSPEQLMGAQLDGRSDLYAVGILAYEMLTGSLPFPVKTPGEMITAHLKTVPPAPSRMIPHVAVPPALDQIILRLLEKQKEKRQANTAELRTELAALISGAAMSRPLAMAAASAPVPVPRAVQAPVAMAPASTAPVARPRKKSGGLPVGVIILLVGVVIAVAGIVGGLVLWK